MKEEKDYIRDIAEIRAMMERSSKFLSLSGWSGIMAGVYAFAGAFIAWKYLGFNPDKIDYANTGNGYGNVFLLSILVLTLAIGTALFDSYKKAKIRGEKAWNTTSRRLLINMMVPLVTGSILILILIFKELIGLIAPVTLIFYGLALYNAGNFTFKVLRIMGLIQIILGLISAYFIEFSLLIWTIGFGLVHIIYGIYMFKYER